MIQIPLSLRISPKAVRPAAAWLILGDTPAIWIASLAGHPAPAELDLYPVPRSRGDRSAVGLLVIPKNSAIAPTGLAIPYGLYKGVYLPVDALLWPPISDAELAELFKCRTNLFHPSIGAVGFASTDRLSFHDLLAAPQRREAAWTRANRGLPPLAKLVSVLPLLPPNPQTFLEEGNEDIGAKAYQPSPPPAGESKIPPMLKAAGTSPFAAVAMLLKKLAAAMARKKKPEEKPPSARTSRATGRPSLSSVVRQRFSNALSTLGDSLANLTPKQFSRLAGALEEHRNREINRLLSMLQNNPEEGLRYALPLSGDAGRGIATPSGRLSQRDIDFNLGKLGGGRPADPWALSNEMREKLRERYRALASREIQLGRYRRAAYIFAKLLNDFSSAANALKQGRYYREAAAIYLERLNNKKTAADCLRDGGLPLEAIPLYESLDMFETVAEIYTTLGQAEEASAAYRKAVSALQSQGHYVKPAKILEEKLHVPREALALLDSGWPNSTQGGSCLGESFRLLARLHDLEEIHTRMRAFRSADNPARHVSALANLFVDIASTAADQVTRRLAADTTRVIVGKHLLNANTAEARTLTDFLPRLSPADRLLPRDAHRYVQKLPPSPVKLPLPHVIPAGAAPRRKDVAIKVIREFDLPKAQWNSFLSAGRVFYALESGYVHQFDWHGKKGASCRVGDFRQSRYQMVHCEKPLQLWIVDPSSHPLHASKSFPATELAGETSVQMPFAPPNLLAAACDEKNLAWILHADTSEGTQLVLTVYESATGNLIGTYPVPAIPSAIDQFPIPVPLAVRYNHVYVAFGNTLFTMAYGREWQTTLLARPVTHAVTSHPLFRARTAVAMESGGLIFTDGLDSAPVAEGLDFPLFAFTRGGGFVACAKSECRIYRFAGKQPEYRGSCDGFGVDALDHNGAVLPTDRMDEFAIVTAKGTAKIINIAAY